MEEGWHLERSAPPSGGKRALCVVFPVQQLWWKSQWMLRRPQRRPLATPKRRPRGRSTVRPEEARRRRCVWLPFVAHPLPMKRESPGKLCIETLFLFTQNNCFSAAGEVEGWQCDALSNDVGLRLGESRQPPSKEGTAQV